MGTHITMKDVPLKQLGAMQFKEVVHGPQEVIDCPGFSKTRTSVQEWGVHSRPLRYRPFHNRADVAFVSLAPHDAKQVALNVRVLQELGNTPSCEWRRATKTQEQEGGLF